LFTIRPGKAKLLPKTFRGVPLTAIGKITRKRDLLVREENDRTWQLLPHGWDPFREKR
jgi:hypothetical protein